MDITRSFELRIPGSSPGGSTSVSVKIKKMPREDLEDLEGSKGIKPYGKIATLVEYASSTPTNLLLRVLSTDVEV